MRRLALLGASGHGKVVADIALTLGWREVEFFDDAWPMRSFNDPWTIAGDTIMLLERLAQFDGVIVSIGNCLIRWEKHQQLRRVGAPLVSLIHPSATVSRYAQIGVGSVVMPSAVVNIGTLVGEAAIINTGASVDHDCRLAMGVHVAPGAHISGEVEIGACTWIGLGAAVKQGLRIGAHVMVGAGATVLHPVGDAMTVVGTPARPLNVNAK